MIPPPPPPPFLSFIRLMTNPVNRAAGLPPVHYQPDLAHMLAAVSSRGKVVPPISPPGAAALLSNLVGLLGILGLFRTALLMHDT